ncbi:hypothetical protein HMPREF9413_3999 [Paenibacillus sp. HGF7]|nr:hypothetical protein HMPREF9413_3999 [Paenibacillus sp. HGF7]
MEMIETFLKVHRMKKYESYKSTIQTKAGGNSKWEFLKDLET